MHSALATRHLLQTKLISVMPRNRILAEMPEGDLNELLQHAELVDLPHKKVLFDPYKRIENVYILEQGVASIVSVFSDASAVETATVGNEGMVGLAIFLDTDRSAGHAFMQVAGSGYRLPAEDFRRMVSDMPQLRESLNHYTQALLTLVAQSSACNRKHSIEERCARWLLMTHDRVRRTDFRLSHEFLAVMLGTRRPTVTVAARALQQAGLITYTYGRVTVLDRKGLERAACPCYGIIRAQFDRVIDA